MLCRVASSRALDIPLSPRCNSSVAADCREAAVQGPHGTSPWLKAQALKLAGESEVTSYSDSNALKQLVAIDCAYLGVIGLVNFAFPFCLVLWACNVAQILVLPSQMPASARRTNPTTTKQ